MQKRLNNEYKIGQKECAWVKFTCFFSHLGRYVAGICKHGKKYKFVLKILKSDANVKNDEMFGTLTVTPNSYTAV